MKKENDSKVWLITGAGRGMGLDIANAALAAGHKVVATGRNPEKVSKAIGNSKNLLVLKLDILKSEEAKSSIAKCTEHFGRLDVLVNNAANFYAGYFEEQTPEEIEKQITTSLMGPMNVTRAALPVMRKQRDGLIITISSSAGFAGVEFGSAYTASKFGIEGWMQSLQPEIKPFGINTMIVNPGFFRTELLTDDSTQYASSNPIDDYRERRIKQMEFWKGANGKQPGDPAKLAKALIQLASLPQPPLRFVAGADAVGSAEHAASELKQQAGAFRELSSSLSFED
ncbi:SDR family oxidoreductase [Chryseolinea sp. T2]|uniref:SDR family oxidoreductase n=1 Tax=Chryseolinea sp. T2 TaxID=3129255 RepID=UPI003078A310